MRLLLISPRKSSNTSRDLFDFQYAATFLGKRKGFCGVPLALPTLAGLTPSNIDTVILDENLEEIDYSYSPDLVGISANTLQITRAYKIADTFRSKGIPVVLGGIHPTILPNEAIEHADSVLIGEAEDVWTDVLEDFRAGQLKDFYRCDNHPDLSQRPRPRRELLQNKKYICDLIQVSRGCPFNCNFCSVHTYLGRHIRTKPVHEVIEEIRNIYANSDNTNYIRFLFVTDDNLFCIPEYTKTLLRQLVELKDELDLSGWVCQASVNMAEDEEALDLLERSGCKNIFIGFESLSERSLKSMGKGVNEIERYSLLIDRVRSHGMDILASFIVGTDADDSSVFESLRAFIEEKNIITNSINILTPFPGTKLFDQFTAEGRILHTEWDQYDMKHVVFRPKRMTPEELEEGFLRIHQQIYSFPSIHRKLKKFVGRRTDIKLPFLLLYKTLFTLRLLTQASIRDVQKNRFILKMIPFVYRPDVDAQLATIVCALDHHDFAQSLMDVSTTAKRESSSRS